MKKYNIAVCGATGLVGRKMLEVLDERKIPIKNLYLFASEKSNGKILIFNNKEYRVKTLSKENIENKKIDFALFSAGGKISKEFAPIFKELGCVVIDNSSAFRMEKDVPLIVPEVNFIDIKKEDKIISNPNCSTIQCVLPLKPLNDLFKLKSINYVTFQAVSGSGKKGIEDLKNSLEGKPNSFYPHPIANNCLPHIGAFLENGFTEEEMKMVNETNKILNLNNIPISATCVRVPVLNSHTVSISAEFEKEIELKEVREALKAFKGIELVDEPLNNVYPLATLSNGKDEVLIGRIRKDLFNPNVLHFISVADNIRKGAATNAVQILEEIIKDKN